MMRTNFEAAIINKSGAVCDKKYVKIIDRDSEGIPTNTITIMHGSTVNGTDAYKYIAINDKTGETNETVYVKHGGKHYRYDDCNITRYRCAKMTGIAISMLYNKPISKVGFIGNGMINLLNCIEITRRFGVDTIVIRGRNGRFAKNVGSFMTVCPNVSVDTSDDLRLLNTCDIVVVCTSSCDVMDTISNDYLKNVDLIIALDCGYILDETFRLERRSYCDYPDQLIAHYADEFPFDKNEHPMLQIEKSNEPIKNAVIYLYGVAIADAVAAEILTERLENDGMEKPFYDD